jgi:hypothetical protein
MGWHRMGWDGIGWNGRACQSTTREGGTITTQELLNNSPFSSPVLLLHYPYPLSRFNCRKKDDLAHYLFCDNHRNDVDSVIRKH